MPKTKKPAGSGSLPPDHAGGGGHVQLPVPAPPDVERLIRQAVDQEIIRAHGPLVKGLALARVLGEEMWDLQAKEPVPEQLKKQIPPLRPVLRAELKGLAIPEDAVTHWIGKALQVQAIEAEAGHRKGKPPRLAAAAEQELRDMTKLLEGGTYLLSARPALEADARRLHEVVIPRLRQLDRTVERLIREDVLGKGRPRALGVRIAAERLVHLMKARTGKSRTGLVAAILKDGGILLKDGGTLPQGTCWTAAPTLGPAQEKALWCRRARKGRSPCPRTPLRCAMETERVETLLKSLGRAKGRKARS
jgi:hypothetical protein